MNFRKKGNKKAQLNISFGMIFSIILIIAFIAFAFYAIKTVLNWQSSLQIETFMNDLQIDVDKIWKGIPETQTVDYSLPNKITFICFQDSEFENLRFISKEIIRGKIIQHIDIGKTLLEKEEFCIQNINGKVIFKLVKNSGEIFVKIVK